MTNSLKGESKISTINTRKNSFYMNQRFRQRQPWPFVVIIVFLLAFWNVASILMPLKQQRGMHE